MRTHSRFALVAAVGLFLGAACEPAPDPGDIPESYRSVLPDERVQVNLNTDYAGARDVGDLAEAYQFTAQVTDDVNGMIGSVLFTVDWITDLDPVWHDAEDNTAVWGPFSDSLDPAETALMVHYEESTDVYTWVVAMRPVGEVEWDAFEAVIAGSVNPGATEDDSDGEFFIDFDVATALDPTSTLGGKFATAYDIDPDGVSAQAAFEQFHEDGSAPFDAYYAYTQDSTGDGQMDLAYLADIDGDGSLLETHYARSRWLADGSGRGDSAVGEGDLGESVGYQSECWGPAPDFGRSFYGNNWDLTAIEGDAGDCVFTDEEFSDEAPTAR